jgi:dTDP-4-dehydrorhamnose 3,5-epimerase-like enzyme
MNPRLICIENFTDERGVLSVCEITQLTGIAFKRFFVISDVRNGMRGGHAHRYTQQVLQCIQGSLTLSLEHNHIKYEYKLSKCSSPILLPCLTWTEMHEITNNCIILVLCSDKYNINNSIRTYAEFSEI